MLKSWVLRMHSFRVVAYTALKVRLSPIIYRFTASILASSLRSIIHHNVCVNGYVIKRRSNVLTLYLSNEMVTDVLIPCSTRRPVILEKRSKHILQVPPDNVNKYLSESVDLTHLFLLNIRLSQSYK